MAESRNILVFDVETQHSFKEIGRANLGKLRISVLGCYDYLNSDYRVYEEKDLMAFERRLRNADLLIGFNIRRFDLPVLQPYLFLNVKDLPILDLLDDVEAVRGHRATLESLTIPTLKQHKSGSGRDAITLFKEGRLADLKQYCLDDVRLTKEIYEYGCREGRIYFTSSWDYKTYEIPVRWKEVTDAVMAQRSSSSANFPTSLF